MFDSSVPAQDDLRAFGITKSRQPGDARVFHAIRVVVFANSLATGGNEILRFEAGSGEVGIIRFRGGASGTVRSQAGAWERVV